MIDISRALAASDYQCQERTNELTWLAEQASKHTNILEIGSWKGCTAVAMATNTTGRVTCIDSWTGGDNKDFHKEIDGHNPDWAFQEFQRNTAGLTNVRAFRLTSIEAAVMLREYTFDMIFIDASHGYEDVKQDILAWRPLLKMGGLFCGHDRQWDGVAKALNELVPDHKVATGAIWYAS